MDGDSTAPKTLDLRPVPIRDDSNRGKRMMGALLGTLQGTTTKRGGASVSISDIEQRIRNRRPNRGDAQESEALKQTILRKRRERKQLEMVKRHEKMRQDARFLQTTSQPSITYLPRVLSRQDSAVIKQQCMGVENDIKKELGEVEP